MAGSNKVFEDEILSRQFLESFTFRGLRDGGEIAFVC